MKKINIGAGRLWRSKGWETLDNGTKSLASSWQNYGKCWESKLKDNNYDIIFTSHTLEHIPQFRIEKTFYEFNRILKRNGTIRILVPDLESSAKAYIKRNKKFFQFSKHYNENLGVGGNFVRQIVSPGGQTIAINREFDEIVGGYAHLFCFDFEMMKILLEKWGFKNIKKCLPGKSRIKELREFQHYVIDGKKYDISDNYLENINEQMKKKGSYISGFDKKWSGQLVVEAQKKKNVNFYENSQFFELQQTRYNSKIDKIKIGIFFKISNIIDMMYKIYCSLKKLFYKN